MFWKVKDNSFSSAEHGNLIGFKATLKILRNYFVVESCRVWNKSLVKSSPGLNCYPHSMN